jgi:putative tryptophan/tyrosine transport system substrate-binding protein
VNRRAFLGGLSGALLAAPRVTPAQPASRVYRLGILAINPRSASFIQVFEQRLRELGWADGKNLAIVFRSPQRPQDTPAMAVDLVRQNVDVIVAGGPEPNLKAATEATRTIPIVMVALNYDPVAKGYVTSVARPGGNVTGVWSLPQEQGPKQLEFLTEILPKVTRIGMLWEAFSRDQLPVIDAAASKLGVQLEKVEVLPPYDFERAFLTLKQRRVGAVLAVGSPIFFRERATLARIAQAHRLPTGGSVSYADSGLLFGFGVEASVPYRRAADYVDRILRGARPADLPVEQPTVYELVVNLKAAKAFGLAIPPSVLLRADRVIE